MKTWEFQATKQESASPYHRHFGKFISLQSDEMFASQNILWLFVTEIKLHFGAGFQCGLWF